MSTPKSAILIRLIDLLTTHETHFFREPHHFTFLRDVILANHPPNAPYTVWCAACATGEEAWSVAMVLAERLGNSSFWSVLASDVSTGALAVAQAGCYPRKRLRSLPVSSDLLVPAHAGTKQETSSIFDQE